jgi:UDP-N-acetylglucosamine transferase subunit ALG13
MILVTTGISGAPFDRLLRAVADIETDDELVVQHGPSEIRPANATCIPFLPFEELSELIAASSTVITHAGAGSVLMCLSRGKRPIVVPRLAEHSEVVDDHQRVFARHLAESGLAVLAEDPRDLAGILATGQQSERSQIGTRSLLVEDISIYLRSLAGAPTGNEVGGHVEDGR